MDTVKNNIFNNLSVKLKVTLALVSALVCTTASAANPLDGLPSGKYELDKSHASIIWSVSHLGLSPYYARFTDFDIDLNLNTEDIAKSSVTASINSASVSTENTKFDAKLSNEKWFKPAEFAAITFLSSAYTPLTAKTGKLVGTMTMFGIEKPVEFDVTLGGALESHPFKANSAAVGFEAKTVIKRSDWGFSKYVPTVGDEVTINISAEFTKALEKGE